MPSPPNTPLDLTNCQRKNSEPAKETPSKTPIPNRRASSDSETTQKSEKIGPKISKKCLSPAKKKSKRPGIFKKIEIDAITLSSDDDETHKEKISIYFEPNLIQPKYSQPWPSSINSAKKGEKHCICIRKVSSLPMLSTLLNQYKLVFELLGWATCTIHLISAPDKLERKQMNYKIRKDNSLLF